MQGVWRRVHRFARLMCWFTLRIKETAEQLLCRIQWRLRCILVHFFLLHRQHFDLHFWLETTTSINQCRFFGFYWLVWVPTFSDLCFLIFCFDCYKWCKLWFCWFLISIAIVNLIILKTFLFWKQLLLFNILWLSNFWLLFYCFGNDLGWLCMNPFWLHGNSTSVQCIAVTLVGNSLGKLGTRLSDPRTFDFDFQLKLYNTQVLGSNRRSTQWVSRFLS